MIRILVEQSQYGCFNMGDLAMIQVAVSRLKNLWPDAVIEVFIFKSFDGLFKKLCSDALPLDPSGQNLWFAPLSERLYELMPSASAQQHLEEFEWQLRCRLPSIIRILMQRKLKKRKRQIQYDNLNSFLNVINSADLVVASGGGYITDTFAEKATISLGILGLATGLGKPTFMLGQGLGPLKNPKLRSKAKTVLPRVDLISLREKRAGIPLLERLGVSPNCVLTTGDDAIELVYENRSTELGNGIGVNLRIADYSNVNTDLLKTVRSALQEIVQQKSTCLIPVPIEFAKSSSDVRTIKQIFAGYDNNSDAGENLKTPVEVIKQISRCRVVVAGSYHAGVFALAQGIPVVGLAKSDYYKDKFLGLADLFGIGCEVIFLDDEQLREKLIASINKIWMFSEELRPQLLESARQQIKLGHAAYQRVYELAESRRK